MTEIDQLLRRLSSPDPVSAEAALARLAVLGLRCIEPLLLLLPAAGDPGRGRMLRLLERLPDERARGLLVAEARSGEPGHRRLAIRALGALGAGRSRRELAALLDEPAEAEVRAELVATLSALAAGGAADLLDPLLDVLFNKGEPPAVRRQVFMALGGLRPRDSRRLLKRLAADPEDPLAEEARQAGEGTPAESLPALAEELARPDSGPGQAGSRLRLTRAGLSAVPSVLRTLQRHGDDPETARRCAGTLGGMDPAARRDLARRLDPDWPPPVLTAALDALAGIPDRRVLAGLARLAAGLGRRWHAEPDPSRAAAIAGLRARAHRLVAAAGSRLAVADLKEALRQEDPPSHDLILALREVGRAEDLADLLPRSRGADPWLRTEIIATAAAIARRTGARRLRQAAATLPGDLAALLPSGAWEGRPGPAGRKPRGDRSATRGEP